LDLTRKLPPEIIQSPAFMKTAFKDFSSVDYLKYYDALDDVRETVVASIGTSNEGKYADLIEEVVDSKTHLPFKRFKGDNLMSNIQSIAATKVGKILNCSSSELEDGTCQPLKGSTNRRITIEEKAATPFAEFDKKGAPWTRDWVHLLPFLLLIQAYDYYYDNRTWKIDFLKAINDINNHQDDIEFKFKHSDGKNFGILYGIDYPHTGMRAEELQGIYLQTLPDFLQNKIIKEIRAIKTSPIKLDLKAMVGDEVPDNNADIDAYIRYRRAKFFEKLNFANISYVENDIDNSLIVNVH